MKKKVLGMVLCTAMLLTACGSDNASTATIATVDGTLISTDAATAIDTTALADGTYAVSFVATDVTTENAATQINVTVYDYEHFDASAIETLTSLAFGNRAQRYISGQSTPAKYRRLFTVSLFLYATGATGLLKVLGKQDSRNGQNAFWKLFVGEC